MEQLTNLNGIKNQLSSINQFSDHVKCSDTNQIFINNQVASDREESIVFDLSEFSSLDMTIFDLGDNSTRSLAFELAANTTLKLVVVSLNTATTKSTITVNLNQPAASCDVNVVSVANTGVNTTYNVICNNNAPQTTANITQRAVALNGGQNEFYATGYIGADCSKAINFQESRVLLLDGASKGDASPILLINHHDVEAGHAASVSRVNDDEMYYLMSRGIDRRTAEELMTVAFIRPVVDKITDEKLREDVFAQVCKKASYEIN